MTPNAVFEQTGCRDRGGRARGAPRSASRSGSRPRGTAVSGRPSHCSGTSVPRSSQIVGVTSTCSVNAVHRCAARRVELRARVADDQRHVERRVEPADLLHEPVVAEQLAVIGRDHDHRACRRGRSRRGGRRCGRVACRPPTPCRSRSPGARAARRVVGAADQRVVDHHAEQRMLRGFLRTRRRAHRGRAPPRGRTSCRTARARDTADVDADRRGARTTACRLGRRRSRGRVR